jgi:hypothetical protein
MSTVSVKYLAALFSVASAFGAAACGGAAGSCAQTVEPVMSKTSVTIAHVYEC